VTEPLVGFAKVHARSTNDESRASASEARSGERAHEAAEAERRIGLMRLQHLMGKLAGSRLERNRDDTRRSKGFDTVCNRDSCAAPVRAGSSSFISRGAPDALAHAVHRLAMDSNAPHAMAYMLAEPHWVGVPGNTQPLPEACRNGRPDGSGVALPLAWADRVVGFLMPLCKARRFEGRRAARSTLAAYAAQAMASG